MNARDESPRQVRLVDYAPPDFLVDAVDLDIELGEDGTTVRAVLDVRRSATARPAAPLRLDGRELELVDVEVNKRRLAPHEYTVDDESLSIAGVPDHCTVTTTVRIHPETNTSLEGLYRSSGNFCTQCEAEGFRKITYFPDRPDVLSVFTTRVVADRERCPVLLSNGNPAGREELPDGRHAAVWHDPHRKPCYLFALVAGDLVHVERPFRTRSGRSVLLQLFVEPRNGEQCEHALRSLELAMRWDEEVYGREYDLDLYMIVAVDDFNMGAMENKGLNIFNSKYVLARPESATDDDYTNIEGVIAHEYFHNWTGNRVTCRDWFQLSLKEGLTVFRDQEFSADQSARAVKRIADVQTLRNHQFPEDAGPMAHPVRPDSYIEINNFYTTTVYNKGAEVVRMLHSLLGPERFRRGMDLYFERHDGEAVTTEDFVAALEDASGLDLEQFRIWYVQAGTPTLRVARHYDASARSFELTVEQHTPPTPGQPAKRPLHMPLRTALLGRDGRHLPMRLEGEDVAPEVPERVLELRDAVQTFRFVDVAEEPVPSLLRGFSAPVKLQAGFTAAELAHLAANDSDPFARWDAGQQLGLRLLLSLVEDLRARRPLAIDSSFVRSFESTLTDERMDRSLLAKALVLPTETYVGEHLDVIDVDGIHDARSFVRREIAVRLRDALERRYHELAPTGPYSTDPAEIGRRSLRNVCLAYLVKSDRDDAVRLAVAQFEAADNMTDRLAALAALASTECDARRDALDRFYADWRDDPLVLDKWFTLQATSELPGTLAEVRALLEHPKFDLKNPNRVRSLIGAFCAGNPVRFHDRDGAGYAFLAEQIVALDSLNPQVAARMAGLFTRWRRYDEGRGAHIRRELERLRKVPDLSKDVYEIVTKSLA